MTAFSLNDRYLREDGTVYLTGIQALVRTLRDRAILDRRRGHHTSSFVSGYEGSPLAGYDLEIARQRRILDGHDIVHQPAVNEELAATSVLGTQLVAQVGRMRTDGVTGYWYGKSPGLDRASDAIRHANLVGTDPHGGAVALVGDDPGGKSSSLACASEVAMADLLIPTLYPADSQDVLDYGLHAPYLSRFTGLWSGLKIVTAVADGAGTAVVHPDRIDPTFGELGPSTYVPTAKLVGPNLMALERSQQHDRLPRALEYARLNHLNRIMVSAPGDRIGIVASGKTYLDVREALTILGLDDADLRRYGIRLLKLGMIYPLDPQIVHTFADGLDEIIVVEEKRAFLETAFRDVLYGRAKAPRVVGKTDPHGRPLVNAFGELDADLVAAALAHRLGEAFEIEPVRRWQQRPKASRITLPLLTRTPYFCSGCPHSASTKVAPDSLVGAGIGCHAMVLLMGDKQVGDVIGLTQMGGEGAQWIGMAPFVEEYHLVQNVGDGTFMHSGSLALRAAVASGVNITYKLLYNATVAMTGGQDPVGAMPLDRIARLLLAEGVTKVVVTTEDRRRIKALDLPSGVQVRDRDELLAVQRELADIPGVTVLIHDQECAAEKRRKRKRGRIATPTTRVMINERICEGCGDCGAKSNCLSVHPVETEFGRKTTIHQSSCNIDYSCLKGDCPSFVTVTPGPTEECTPVPDIAAGLLREPERAAVGDEFGIRILGVGGTGVVTVAQILATAAVIDGKFVRSLDQTGLAQKGGAVVSDLKIATRPLQQAAKISERRCSLYLACDSLVGTDPNNLKVTDKATTVAVVSTTEIPTGQMIVDASTHFPQLSAIRSAVDAATSRAVYLDPVGLSRDLFDDEQYTNMLLVGAAYQTGALPIPADAIERAITLNGAAVDRNVQAFRRGRQAIADPDALATTINANRRGQFTPALPSARAQEIAATVRAGAGSELARIVGLRTADLIDYQNASYARDYVGFVEQVRGAEAAAVPNSTVLTEAVARNLYKLMAYKDEYEVARLALDPAFDAAVKEAFGSGAKRSIRLHPPLLRAMGMKNKLSLGPWVTPALRLLHALRRIRGSKLDVFGYHHIRRMERALITEYRDTVDTLLKDLNPATLAAAVEIAALPDMVRGYEQIKADNVDAYHRSRSRLLARIPTRQPCGRWRADMNRYRPRWHDDEVSAVSDLAVDFFEREVVPHVERWDAQRRIDREVWLAAGKLGLLLCSVPEEYGGGGGTFAHDLAVFEAQGYSGDLSFGVSVHSGIVPHYILAYGSEEQKRTWLPGMATGEIIGAIGMTEPGAGSDLKAIKTTAVRDGDEYVVNGSKTFITNGSTADIIVLAVKTDPKAGARGVSLIIVDVRDCPGFAVGRVLDKVGQHGADTSELSFADVRVPVSNLLGEAEGQGFAQLMAQLVQERLIIGAQTIGAMERAVHETVRYTKARNAFGHSLFEFQNTAFELAECHTIARTSRVFFDHCVERHLRGELDATEAAMAKYWLTDNHCEVVDRCVQLHGGYGYMREYLIARMYEDARVQRIYGGANEVMKSIIARAM